MNSAVFVPFLINISINLLNQELQLKSLKKRIDLAKCIGQWGGGLDVLRECLKDWTMLVNTCCNTTPIDHPIWKSFANNYNINKTEAFDILCHVLRHWIIQGEQLSKPGAYPSEYELQQYFSLDNIMKYTNLINKKINKGLFDKALYTEYDIETEIEYNNEEKHNDIILDEQWVIPLMVHVVIKLLNDSGELHEHYNIENIVSQYFVDLNRFSGWNQCDFDLNNCYSKWNYFINECCTATPINHFIWRQLLLTYDEPINHKEDIDILECLLSIWRNYNGSYSPTKTEQEKYINITKINHIYYLMQKQHSNDMPVFDDKTQDVLVFDKSKTQIKNQLKMNIKALNCNKTIVCVVF
eukprot:76213_1